METPVGLREERANYVWHAPLRPVPSLLSLEPPSEKSELFGSSQGRLAALWYELVSGSLRIVTEHSDATHHYLELTRSSSGPLAPHELSRWRPILLGTPQKVVAAEVGCANSTVACSAAHCLRGLGLNRTSREVPMLLVMMAHASAEPFRGAPKPGLPSDAAGSFMFSAMRPDTALAGVLSPSELDVVRLRVNGLSHRQIGSVRTTSARTVANQLASVYAKLGVSGRPELLAALVKSTWKHRARLRSKQLADD